jgi:CheY-like chemotaxis protein
LKTPKNTIILIDDDPITLKVLGERLEKYGLNIERYTCPEEGLKAVVDRKIPLTIIDYHIPKIDGAQLITKFSEEKVFQYTEVILYTGADLSDYDLLKLRTLGFSYIIKKPISKVAIEEIVTQYFPGLAKQAA